jgi:hypothetical protein
MLSDETVLKCLPDREAVLANIREAKSLLKTEMLSSDIDKQRELTYIQICLKNLNIKKAVEVSKNAGYVCMARAIELHWPT